MSASSHTRGHRYAPELTACVLAWLESHGRHVLNGRRALQLEVSKVEQYEALRQFGIRTPRTIAAIGGDAIMEAAQSFAGPFITKHNRAGKGLGVRLFQSLEPLTAYVSGPDFEDSVDGITLVQEYIQAPEPFITRCEFIGGRFFYAVRVDTSEGFELCPADVCNVGDEFCPAESRGPKFRILQGFAPPELAPYERFLEANAIGIAGIEFVTDADGQAWTYDVNTNTNYNPDAERVAGRFGMREVARVLGGHFARLYGTSSDLESSRNRAA